MKDAVRRLAVVALAALAATSALAQSAAPPTATAAPAMAAAPRAADSEAAKLAPLFKSATFKGNAGTTLPYRYFEPAAKDATGKFPVILYLHGEGEAGTDNTAQVTTTDNATVWMEPRHRAENPSYVLAPQIAKGKDWTSDAVYTDTLALLDQFIKAHPQADTNRLYIVGFSMGATGLYNIILRNPTRFAAAMPISGSADKYLADTQAWAALKHMPIIVIHSWDDTVVPVSAAQNAINALRVAGNTFLSGSGGPTPCLWSPGSTPVPHDAWWTAFRKFEVVYYSLFLGDLGRTEHGALDPMTLYTHKDLGGGIVQVWDWALGTAMVIERADKAVIIDTTMGQIGRDGGIFQYIRNHVLKNKDLDVEVFITHQHADHIIGLASFVGAAQVKKIYVHQEDSAPVRRIMGRDAAKVTLVKDGDHVTLGGKDIEVIGVRGHTFGSIVMKYENYLFSGDSIGTGYVGISQISVEEYLDSLQHLLDRMGNGRYIVHGAHTGEVTSQLTDQYVRDMVEVVTRVVKGAVASPTYWRSNDIATRRVSAVRGSAITYNYNDVHRVRGALRGLQVSKGVLAQGFEPPVPDYVDAVRNPPVLRAGFFAYITQYFTTVDANTDALDITATVRDLDARGLTVKGAAVRSGEPYHAALNPGRNSFPIVVTAGDGTTRTYSLLVVRNAPAAPAPAGAAVAPAPAGPPDVRPDRTITFRYRAPRAAEVTLRFGEGEPRVVPMKKGGDGVWSATVGPVEPEIYAYSFVVDGAKAIDLANPLTKGGATVDTSIIEVPGSPPRFDQVREVPHGSISIRTYTSKALNLQRSVYVYLPPGYDTQSRQRYPVLYLYHGGGGSEQEWSREGRTGAILDNLLAQKRAVPMIVVMPNNVPTTPAPGTQVLAAVPADTAAGRASANELLQRELLDDLIPWIDGTYRTVADREHRAIAGLSAGGGTALNVGLNSLDSFAWVSEFSTGAFGGIPSYPPFDLDKMAPNLTKDPAATNRRLKLLYMSVGTEDPRLPFQTKALELFQQRGLHPVFQTFPGYHEWKVWRHSLADLAPRLFR